MFGVGPGALPSDAHMMGIDPADLRPRMEEALVALTALLAGEAPVSMQTDWFTLRDAQTQLRPYSWPGIEIAVAAQVSPAGPRAAGRFGAGLLSLGATSTGGFDVLGHNSRPMTSPILTSETTIASDSRFSRMSRMKTPSTFT